ncbi:MAG: hypothetical protein ACREJG_14175, partial [Candidatus Rokuibacteriota bacterium]
MMPATSVAGAAAAVVRHVHDPEEWNRLVQTFPHHDIKQGYEWSVVRAEHGWRAFRVAAFE